MVMPNYSYPEETQGELYKHRNIRRESLNLTHKVEERSHAETSQRGAYGFWQPGRGTGAVDESLPQSFKEFVKQHEGEGHGSFGYDGSAHGEYMADIIAAWKTGKPQHVRGPFYQPPLKTYSN